MAKEIWKYELEVTDVQEIQMLSGADILCVQVQRERPCLWAIVDTNEGFADRRTIITKGTGHSFEYDSGMKYIGTYQLRDGDLVFHVFECKR